MEKGQSACRVAFIFHFNYDVDFDHLDQRDFNQRKCALIHVELEVTTMINVKSVMLCSRRGWGRERDTVKNKINPVAVQLCVITRRQASLVSD